MDTKHCPNCQRDLPKTEEYFYPNRRSDRKTVGWQSYCRDCWPVINQENKDRRKRQFVYGVS